MQLTLIAEIFSMRDVRYLGSTKEPFQASQIEALGKLCKNVSLEIPCASFSDNAFDVRYTDHETDETIVIHRSLEGNISLMLIDHLFVIGIEGTNYIFVI